MKRLRCIKKLILCFAVALGVLGALPGSTLKAEAGTSLGSEYFDGNGSYNEGFRVRGYTGYISYPKKSSVPWGGEETFGEAYGYSGESFIYRRKTMGHGDGVLVEGAPGVVEYDRTVAIYGDFDVIALNGSYTWTTSSKGTGYESGTFVANKSLGLTGRTFTLSYDEYLDCDGEFMYITSSRNIDTDLPDYYAVPLTQDIGQASPYLYTNTEKMASSGNSWTVVRMNIETGKWSTASQNYDNYYSYVEQPFCMLSKDHILFVQDEASQDFPGGLCTAEPFRANSGYGIVTVIYDVANPSYSDAVFDGKTLTMKVSSSNKTYAMITKGDRFTGTLYQVGKIKDAGTSVAEFQLPQDWDPTTMKLYIFDAKPMSRCNYASSPIEVVYTDASGGAGSGSNSGSSIPSTDPDFSLGDANDVLAPDYLENGGRVAVDFDKEVATLANVSGYDVAYALVKMDTKTYIHHISPQHWESATEDEQIDLSWIPKNRESALVFRFTSSGGAITYDMLHCKKQDSTLKVGRAVTSSAIAINNLVKQPDFSGQLMGNTNDGYFYFYTLDKTNKTATPVSPVAIQWRKGTNGNWINESEDSVLNYVDSFKKAGVNIYFRIRSDGKIWPSKEVKYSYKKQAAAPNVVYKLKDSTFSLKAGQEYKVKVGNSEWSDWIAVSEIYGKSTKSIALDKLCTSISDSGKTTLNLDDIYTASGGSVSIRVRTAADIVKGKYCSKEALLKLTTPASGVAINTTGSAISIGFKDVEDESKGLVVTNSSEVDYEYGITIEGKLPARWYTVRAGKTANISASNYTTRSAVVVREVGDIKNYRLPGKEIYFSIVTLK